MSLLKNRRILLVLLLIALVMAVIFLRPGPAPSQTTASVGANATAQHKTALTVRLVMPQRLDWPETLAATGNVFAWQEAIIEPEIANYRITEVLVQVGDSVKKGQVLARIAQDTVASEVAEAAASVAELSAAAEEAKANAARARELRTRGFYSEQLNTQYQTSARTVNARLAQAQAREQTVRLRLSKTRVLAPDDGLISAQNAVVGSLTQPGQELFRLIRGGRLEWRAEVPSSEILRITPGLTASLAGPDASLVEGRVRVVAPSVDPQTRNALVYVDLPLGGVLRAGMFAAGEFSFQSQPALTLPQTAVVLREGFAYVFSLDEKKMEEKAPANADSVVRQVKVELGRRVGERVEIRAGLAEKTPVIESGVGFLADGDRVSVVEP